MLESIKNDNNLGGSIPESLKLAINALEKQIPMKVVEERNIYLCPNCGSSAETDCGDDMLDYRLNYCDNCGQKLDWSDYE